MHGVWGPNTRYAFVGVAGAGLTVAGSLGLWWAIEGADGPVGGSFARDVLPPLAFLLLGVGLLVAFARHLRAKPREPLQSGGSGSQQPPPD